MLHCVDATIPLRPKPTSILGQGGPRSEHHQHPAGDAMSLFHRDSESSCQGMIQEIARDVTRSGERIHRHALGPSIMDAMSRVPRHQFVPADLVNSAYVNAPLPIGRGQTISQPFIVALMTDLLCPEPDHTVLEVGTGCGYQTAVLATLVRQVYSLELIPDLADSARERLLRLGFNNLQIRCGDGYRGWPEHAPYDGIIVTAAATHVPGPLVEQLKPGRCMVIPVGKPHRSQQLIVVRKSKNGQCRSESVLDVAFVPLRRSLPEH